MKKVIFLALAVVFCLSISSVKAQEYSFNTDLALGNSGPDVVSLQTYLISQGFDIPSVSSGATAKGYFGQQTALALKRFQTSKGISATGYFGPLTRGVMNGYRGGSLVVSAPNGGEYWQRGSYQVIKWTAAPGIYNQTGSIWLDSYVPPCAELTYSGIRCLIATVPPRLIAQNINLSNQSYGWNVGTILETNVSIPSAVPDGQYKIRICPSNSNSCDSSNAYFSITTSGGQGSYSPVINGIDAPTSLSTGQTGTWTVRAYDPQNSGNLQYSVDWGDSSTYYPTTASSQLYYSQSATFTHSYSNPGTYTVRFTVRNNSGYTAQSSATVTVSGYSSGTGALRVSSPNGGEYWTIGSYQNIYWTSPTYIRATYADIKLQPVQPACPTGYMCTMSMPSPITIATNVSINSNSYYWNVGQVRDNSGSSYTAPAGQYYVQICEAGTYVCDMSDSSFTISTSQGSGSDYGLPDINIIYPNGGEALVPGSSQYLTLKISGDRSRAGGLVTVYLSDMNNQNTYITTFNSASYGTQSYYVTVPANISSGNYRLYATLADSYGQIQAYDYTDGYVTINNGSYYCPVGYVCVPR